MISSLTSNSIRDDAQAPARLEIRKARMSDIPSLLDLINRYATRGAESIRDFSVALADSQLAGCGALHSYSPTGDDCLRCPKFQSAMRSPSCGNATATLGQHPPQIGAVKSSG
jgi:hypothetical protein